MKAITIAVPLHDGRVSPLFDVARRFLLVDSGISEKRTYIITSDDLGVSIVDRLKEERVNIIICSAISGVYIKIVLSRGINLIPGVTGAADEVLEAFLDNKLVTDRFAMPGCAWRRRFRGRQCPYYNEIHSMENNKKGDKL